MPTPDKMRTPETLPKTQTWPQVAASPLVSAALEARLVPLMKARPADAGQVDVLLGLFDQHGADHRDRVRGLLLLAASGMAIRHGRISTGDWATVLKTPSPPGDLEWLLDATPQSRLIERYKKLLCRLLVAGCINRGEIVKGVSY